VCFPGDFIVQTSSLSSDMVGIPTADEFMKHKEEFDAKIDSGSDDLNAGLLSLCSLQNFITVPTLLCLLFTELPSYFMYQGNHALF